MIAILICVRWCLTVVLICISLIIGSVKHLSYAYWLLSLRKCPFRCSAYFLIGLFFSLLSCIRCFFILEVKLYGSHHFANIFSWSVCCLFTSLMVSFALKGLEVWLGPICLSLPLFVLSWETDLRKHWYSLCQRMFCLCSLLVLWCHVLYFTSLSHFEFIFVYDVRVCSDFSDLHAAVQLFQHCLLKVLSFPHCVFLITLSNISCPYIHCFISGFYCISVESSGFYVSPILFWLL